LDFLKDHPRLRDAVSFIWNEEGGTGVEGKKISTYLSLGYAAGLLYLMGVASTDPDKYVNNGPEALNDKLWGKAEEFWTLFAGRTDKEPLKSLVHLLARADASGASGRDDILGMVVNAYNLWIDGETGTAKDIKVKMRKDDTGRMVPVEVPRLGGIDVEIEVEQPEEEEPGNPSS
jgi:hypothetical protein